MASAAASTNIFSNAEEGEKVVNATTEFMWNLYKTIAEKTTNENVFLSPVSISVALAMTSLGARGETESQMKEVMKLAGVSEDHLHSSFADLVASLRKADCPYTIHSANRLYGQQGYNFLPEFLENTKKHYAAEMEAVDYADHEAARLNINSWVEKETVSKIKDLIPSGVLNPLVRLVLVNAIYFKGDWTTKFDPKNTRKADFFVSNDEKVQVDMMFQHEFFQCGFNRELNTHLLEMPYKGDDLSMVILLPEKKSGLTVDDLESKLTLAHLLDLSKSFRMSKVKVEASVPKFKIEQKFDLTDTLSSMGMSHLFDAQNADLSGIDGTRGLFMSKVLHKAFIEVNEEGSEAAAATAGVAMLRSMPRKFIFNADHPFLFFIRDKNAGTILFFGKMIRPNASQSKDEL